MKTLKIVLIVLAVAVAGVLALAATKPDTFRVQRTASIKAPPEKIAGVLSDFHGWGAWSPWEKLDPDMKRTYSGAPSGKGAAYAWQGNGKVGQGRMEITEAASARVALNLDFVKPFEAHNKVEFNLAPKGDATEVTWPMVGPQFESGLANLKAITER